MNTASIGFTRKDGDFQILATLSNSEGLIGTPRFISIVETLRQSLQAAQDEPLEVLERQDAPDYVTIETV